MITVCRGNTSPAAFRQPPREERLRVEGLVRNLEYRTNYVPDTPFAADAVHGFGILGVFSQCTGKENREMALSFFRTALAGETLLDLGAGPLASVYAMAEFAAICGAKEYIAVDRYSRYSEATRAHLAEHIRSGHPEADMSIGMYEEDMLMHLMYRANGSANVLLNGIDGCVIPSGQNSLYIAELMNQIARVVPQFGIVFGINSPFLGVLTRAGFLKLTELPGHGEIRELPGFKEAILVKP